MSTVLPEEQINLKALQNAAGKACSLLKILANHDRLLLLCQMSQGEYAVAELEALTGIRQPTLSQQLMVLRQEKLVATSREGKQIFYRYPALLEALANAAASAFAGSFWVVGNLICATVPYSRPGIS